MGPGGTKPQLHHNLQSQGQHSGAGQPDAFLFEALQINPHVVGSMKAGPPRPQPRCAPAIVSKFFAEAKLQRMLLRPDDQKTVDGKHGQNGRPERNAFQETGQRKRIAETSKIERIPADRVRAVGLKRSVLASADEKGRPQPPSQVEEKKYPTSRVKHQCFWTRDKRKRPAEQTHHCHRHKNHRTQKSAATKARDPAHAGARWNHARWMCSDFSGGHRGEKCQGFVNQ